VQGRGGKGVITIKTSERNGDVVGIVLVKPADQLMIITDGGQLIRTRVDEISVYSRNTQGVRVMHIAEDEEIVSIARIREEDLAEDEEGEEGEGEEGEGEGSEDGTSEETEGASDTEDSVDGSEEE